MQLGNLTDSLLDMGKEKAKEMAEGVLGEQEAEGGLKGAAAGFGKDLLGNVLGGNEESPAEDSVEEERGDDDSDNENDDR
jgi:hypothetical protein